MPNRFGWNKGDIKLARATVLDTARLLVKALDCALPTSSDIITVGGGHMAKDADWEEGKHKRGKGGQFASASELPDRKTEPDPHKRLDVYRSHYDTTTPSKTRQPNEFMTPHTRALEALTTAGEHAANHRTHSDWGDEARAKRSASGVHRKLDEYKQHMIENEQRSQKETGMVEHEQANPPAAKVSHASEKINERQYRALEAGQTVEGIRPLSPGKVLKEANGFKMVEGVALP